MTEKSREYEVRSPDPHRCGFITVTLGEFGLAVRWLGDDKVLVHLRPDDLVDLTRVRDAEGELAWIREEAKAAMSAIAESRDELRAMIRAVKPTEQPRVIAPEGDQ